MDSQQQGNQPSDKSEQQALSQSPPDPAITKTEIPSDTTKEGKRDKDTASELAREFRWFEILSLVINGALAVTGICVLYVYSGQLEVMQRQLDQMKGGSAQTDRLISETHDLAAATKAQSDSSRIIAENARIATSAAIEQARISARSAKAAEDALRLTEAAEFQVDNIRCAPNAPLGLNTEINMTYKNTGRGTATRVETYLFHGVYGSTINPIEPGSESTIGAGGVVTTARLLVAKSTNEQFLKLITDGMTRFHVWGWISYQDRFHRRHLLVHDSAYVPKSNCDFVTVRIVSMPR